VLALAYARFQLQQREALSPHRRLSTIATLPNPRSRFHMPPNPNAHPTFRFEKTVCRNPTTSTADHKNKYESAGLMDGYFVVGVTAIPYLRFGVIISHVSKDDITYRVTIADIPHCICLDFTKMSSHALGKKGNGCIANIFIMCLDFCAMWIMRVISSFMHLHIPTTRSCDYLNLMVLYSVSSIASVLLSRMLVNDMSSFGLE